MKSLSADNVLLARDFLVSVASAGLGIEEQELVLGFRYAYKPLTEAEKLKLAKELAIVDLSEIKEKVMKLSNPFIEMGITQGRAQGRAQGREMGRREEGAAIIIRMLNRRLGPIPASQRERIRRLNLRQIRALADSLLEFQSRSDLVQWLNRRRS